MSRFARDKRSKKSKNIVVFTEGSHTEKMYFRWFARQLSQLRIVSPERKEDEHGKLIDDVGWVKPSEILNRAINYCKSNRHTLYSEDQIWFVLDADKLSDYHKVEEFINDINTANLNVAVSNRHLVLSMPCFELWQYLHLNKVPPNTTYKNCPELVEKLMPNGGFDPTKHISVESVNKAILLAKNMDINGLVPSNPSTRVYLLAEVLLDMLKG